MSNKVEKAVSDRLALARRLFHERYSDCFWFLRRDLEISVADLPTLAAALRKYGNRNDYILAAELCRSQIFKD